MKRTSTNSQPVWMRKANTKQFLWSPSNAMLVERNRAYSLFRSDEKYLKGDCLLLMSRTFLFFLNDKHIFFAFPLSLHSTSKFFSYKTKTANVMQSTVVLGEHNLIMFLTSTHTFVCLEIVYTREVFEVLASPVCHCNLHNSVVIASQCGIAFLGNTYLVGLRAFS